MTRKKETFIYNHRSPTRVHNRAKQGMYRPQCPILTTITVTLSAEPRCTALLASLLHAAS